jgi:hypothetical protein
VLTGVISQIDLAIQAINNKQYKKAANIFSSGDLNPGMLGLFPNLVYALENLSDMEETTLVIPEIRYALDVYEKFKTSPNDYAPEFMQALGEFKQYLMNRTREAQIDEDYTGEFAAEVTPAINPYGGLKDRKHRGMIGETPTDNPTGASGEGGWRKYKPKPAGEIDEDTAYAGGMGQGGNAGESYRKFKPKSAGTFKEDELDEACWKGYHKEGNKKMFGKTYPNCVKNTNEEEQLDEKCWDTHKQVGMKNKGGRQVPNCVPKESAIMRGLKR